MATGKAQKKYLNKVAKIAQALIQKKAREKAVLAMEDEKEYYDSKFNLTMIGKEWKKLIKKESDE
jgi:chromosome segregation and condensation protein ScpB